MGHNEDMMADMLASLARIGRKDVMVEQGANGMVRLHAVDGHWIGPTNVVRQVLDRTSDDRGSDAAFWDGFPRRSDAEMVLLWINHGSEVSLYEDVARAILEPGLSSGTTTRGGRHVGQCLPRLISAIQECVTRGWATRIPLAEGQAHVELGPNHTVQLTRTLLGLAHMNSLELKPLA